MFDTAPPTEIVSMFDDIVRARRDRETRALERLSAVKSESAEKDAALDAMSNELAELKASDKGELEALQRDFQALLDEKEATRRELAAVRVSFNDADKARLELCDRFDSFEVELRRETKAALDARNDLEEALKENARLVEERKELVRYAVESWSIVFDGPPPNQVGGVLRDLLAEIKRIGSDTADAAERAMEVAELRIEELVIRCERQERIIDALLDKGGQ